MTREHLLHYPQLLLLIDPIIFHTYILVYGPIDLILRQAIKLYRLVI